MYKQTYNNEFKYLKKNERENETFQMKTNQSKIKEEWIKKDLKNKIQKLNQKVIFIPRKTELNF